MGLFSDFCAAVTAQVRFKPDHTAITAELTTHLEDHRDALVSRGVPPEQAEQDAVAAMGDPVEIGRALSKLHNPVLGWVQVVFHALLWITGVLGVIFFIFYLCSTDGPIFSINRTISQLTLSDLNIAPTVTDNSALATFSADCAAKAGAYTFRIGEASIYEGTEADTYIVVFPLTVTWYNPWLQAPALGYLLYCADMSDETFSDVGAIYMEEGFCSVRYLVYATVPDDLTELTIACDHIQCDAASVAISFAIDYPFVLTIPLTGGDLNA